MFGRIGGIVGLGLLLSACGTMTVDRALSGAVIGGAGGAAIGAAGGAPIAGAVLGAVAGAAVGAFTDSQTFDLGKPPWR